MVKTGSSYCSQSELPLTFGLGAATKVKDVEVVVAERPRRSRCRRRGRPDDHDPGRQGRAQRNAPFERQRHDASRAVCLSPPRCCSSPAASRSRADAARDRLERAYRANNLGVAQLEQFDYDAAADAFREALQIDASLSLRASQPRDRAALRQPPTRRAPEARAAVAALPDRPQPLVRARPDRPRRQPDRRRGRGVPARARARSGRRRRRRSISDRCSCSSASSTRPSQLFRRRSTAEPYNVTAAYNLATALTRGRPDRRGPAGDAALPDAARQRLRRTYAQSYLQQGRYARSDGVDRRRAGARRRATPAVTFTDATSTAFAVGDASGRGGPGSVLLFDVDNDGDLDLFTVGADGLHLFRNDGGRFTDVTAAAHLGVERRPRASRRLRATTTTTGEPDLFAAASDRRQSLLHQRGRRHVRRT